MFNRGRCHLRGIGTGVDVAKALEWLTTAAEDVDNDLFYDEHAMALLAMMFQNGEGVEKDEAKAQEWQAKLDELKKKRTEEIPGYVSPV